MNVKPGGNGIEWKDHTRMSAEDLYPLGENLLLSEADLQNIFIQLYVSGTEACKMLRCSKQYLNQLVKKGKLKPVCSIGRQNVFLKRDIEAHEW